MRRSSTTSIRTISRCTSGLRRRAPSVRRASRSERRSSADRPSGRSRSCTAPPRSRTRRCRSATISSTPPTSPHGVVRASVETRGAGLEAAAFRGQEPDEQRTDLDLGRLDSQAVRVSYLRGAWDAQVSVAWLTRPERLSTYDAERRTASLAYTRTRGTRTLAVTVAAGQNREAHGNLEAYLAEAMFRPSPAWAGYTRVEWLDKDILDAGFHPIGVGHTHRQSRVGAFTLGGVKDVASGAFGRLGLGRGCDDVPRAGEPAGVVRAAALAARLRALLRPLRQRHRTPALSATRSSRSPSARSSPSSRAPRDRPALPAGCRPSRT